MNKAVTWNINGVGFDAREAAREAARRQGKSLGEWLHDVIADHAADLGVEQKDVDGQARIDAVTAKLERLAARTESTLSRSSEQRAERPRGKARRADSDSVDSDHFEPAYDAPEDDERPAQFRRSDREWPSERMREDRRPARTRAATYDTEALLDDAIGAMERRVLRTERKTDQALASFAKLIETSASKRADEHEMFAALSRKLSDMDARLKERTPDDSPIKNALARLEARLEAPVAPAKPASDEPIQRLEAKLNSILDAVTTKAAHETMQTSALAAAQARRAPIAEPRLPPVPTPAFANRRLGKAIAEIANHQRALETGVAGHRDSGAMRPNAGRPMMPYAAAPARDDLHDSIAALTAKIEDMRRDMVTRTIADKRDTTSTHIDALRAEIAGMAQTLRDASPRDGAAVQLAQMTTALDTMRRDIARREDERRYQDAKLTEVASRADLDGLKAEIGDISKTLSQLAPRNSVTALEDAIRGLTARMEATRQSLSQESAMRPLEDIVGDLRHSLADIGTRDTIGGLERDVRAIGGKLDTLDGADVSAISSLQAQTREIRDLLSAATSHPLAVDRIEQQVATLSEKFDRQPVLSTSESQAFRAVTDEIRTLLENPPGMALFDKIERRLEDLTTKIDQAVDEASGARRIAELSKRRFDDVQEQLAARLDDATPSAGPDAQSLEHLVRDLSARIEAVRAPDASSEAIEALQSQILRLSNRFERTDSELSTLSAIERSMHELFAHLEQTRAKGTLADPSTAREIADLKAIQEDADHRTHVTLNAVHETLEKVVDRFSMMENDVANGRAQRGATSRPAAAADLDDSFVGRPSPTSTPLPDLMLHASDAMGAPAGPFKTIDRTRTPSFAPSRPAATDLDETAGRADFIAAARRAARTAQTDPSVLAMKRPETPAAPSDVRAGLMAKTRDYVASHKKPVLLGIAALFVILGTLSVMGSLTMGDGSRQVAAKAPTVAVAPVKTAYVEPRRIVPEDAASRPMSADLTPSALPKAPAPASGALPGSDPVTTGSIISRIPSFAAQGATTAAPVAPSGALRQMAEDGNADAQYEVGSRYAEGRLLIKDFKLAADWYEKAAQQGLAPAQYKLAALYEKGLGVPRDKAKAKFWYIKAADAGNPRAMHNLAVMVADGDGKPDYTSAVIWFRKAAEYGIHDSQYNLGILLARGLGTPQSLVQSYQWLAIAAQQNDADAATKRDEVAAKLSPADLTVAKTLASTFHPKTADVAAMTIEPPAGGWDGASSPSLVKSARPKLSSL